MSGPSSLRLIAITDLQAYGETALLAGWERLARAALPETVAIDLRERALSARAQLTLASQLLEIARAHRQLSLINDRLDLALIVGSDGVHLGEASVDTASARALVGSQWIVRACHDAEWVAQIEADLVLLSPIFEARKGNRALGLAALTRARGLLDASADEGKRLFALGGVTASTAALALSAGAHGVAAIGSLWGDRDPTALLGALGIARPLVHSL